MTNEKALKITEALIKWLEPIPAARDTHDMDYTLCVKSALEKQIPKKPITRSEGMFEYYNCQVCHGRLIGKAYNYCPYCGQKIDYSEVEK